MFIIMGSKREWLFWNSLLVALGLAALLLVFNPALAAEEKLTELDSKVRALLDSSRDSWHDLNVPEEDGRILYDLIVDNNYTRALEIGTSTGRSAIWMAWAMSKTGGKLVTIEINSRRHSQAVANFHAAGLSDYVDARLGDAHELVAEVDGPLDFVFSDADKQWYKRYLELVLPKLAVGGCFAAHNVSNLSFMRGIKEFLAYARALPELETTFSKHSSAGLSLSFKRELTP